MNPSDGVKSRSFPFCHGSRTWRIRLQTLDYQARTIFLEAGGDRLLRE